MALHLFGSVELVSTVVERVPEFGDDALAKMVSDWGWFSSGLERTETGKLVVSMLGEGRSARVLRLAAQRKAD
jgi:hypothetical protein